MYSLYCITLNCCLFAGNTPKQHKSLLQISNPREFRPVLITPQHSETFTLTLTWSLLCPYDLDWFLNSRDSSLDTGRFDIFSDQFEKDYKLQHRKVVRMQQCFGSESGWIRILMDPDLDGSGFFRRSGSGLKNPDLDPSVFFFLIFFALISGLLNILGSKWCSLTKKDWLTLSVAEPKLLNFDSSSGSTFPFILAPAPALALYCHLNNEKTFWFDNIKTVQQK